MPTVERDLIGSGNRCGHDPARPVLQLVRPTSDRMIPLIVEATERAEVVFYDQREFPELGGRRSERREALVRVLKALIYRMDLVTRRVGQLDMDTGYVIGIPVRQLRAWTGLSHWRVERAIEDLKRAGYSTAAQPVELRTDDQGRPLLDARGRPRYKGLAAIRTVSRRLLRRLGLIFSFDLAAKGVAKKRAREAAAAAAAAPAPIIPRPRSLDDRRRPGGRITKLLQREARPEGYGAMLAKVWSEHRDWPAEQLRAEAQRRCTGPPG